MNCSDWLLQFIDRIENGVRDSHQLHFVSGWKSSCNSICHILGTSSIEKEIDALKVANETFYEPSSLPSNGSLEIGMLLRALIL